MTDKKLLRILFNNAVEEIKSNTQLSYADIARLSGIKKGRADNIRNERSTPDIGIVQKLLTAFAEVKPHFDEVEEIRKVEEEKDLNYKKELAQLNERIDRCTEERSTCKASLAVLQEEIKELKEIVAIQNVLLDKHGIMREKKGKGK